MKRALFIGFIISLFIGVLEPYFLMRIQPNGLCSDFITTGAYFFIFLIILFSFLLSFISKRFVLTQEELILIFTMVAVACVMPSWGVVGNLFAAIAGLKYFATPTNEWEEIFLKKIKDFVINKNELAVRFFYEGLPKGCKDLFLFSWLKPFIFWFFIVFVFSFLSICITVILRKQWVENERLVFPLAILPLEVFNKEKEDRIPKIFKNKLMWIGFIISFILLSLNGVTYFFPSFKIVFVKHIPIFRNTDTLIIFLSFPIMAFAYLLPLNIAFSLVFFHLILKIETGYFNLIGFTLPGENEIFGGSSAATSFQSGGAMVFLFFYIIWLSRRHLKDVFLKAIGRKDIDDSKEILSYRASFFGWLISLILFMFLLKIIDMPFIVIITFLFFVHVVFIVLTKIVAQAGIGFLRSACVPPHFSAYLLPPSLVKDNGYISLGLQYIWSADIRTTVMASVFNGEKMRENFEDKIKGKIFLWGIVLSIIFSYCASFFTTLFIGYKYGALNSANIWFYNQGMPNAIGKFIALKIKYPLERNIILSRVGFLFIGMVIMSILIFLQKFPWFPLHYIAFPIADTHVARWAWFSVFISWLIKFIILKYGGVNVYKKSIPFFIGLFLGIIGAISVWVPINILYEETINKFLIGVP